jgi:hypothetical protein
MERINEQRDRLLEALKVCPPGPRYGQLHAALHALNWAADAQTFEPPCRYINGIREGSPDYSKDSRLAPSPDNTCQTLDAA